MAKISSSALQSANSLSDVLSAISNPDTSSWGKTSSGDYFTSTEEAAYYYDYWSTQDERDYNEWYYNTYESPSAMVSQYQEAGLNPALMYGSGASTTSTNVSEGYNTPSSGRGPMNSSFDKLMSILQFVSSIASTASNISLNKANAKKGEAEANEIAYDLSQRKQADAKTNPETGETRSSAELDKDIKMWQSYAAEANAIKAFSDADASKIQTNWLKDLYDEGYNLAKLQAEGQDIDNQLKRFQSEINSYFRSNGYYGYQLRKLLSETLIAEGQSKQVDFDTAWLSDMPAWLKPVIGVLSKVLGTVSFKF